MSCWCSICCGGWLLNGVGWVAPHPVTLLSMLTGRSSSMDESLLPLHQDTVKSSMQADMSFKVFNPKYWGIRGERIHMPQRQDLWPGMNFARQKNLARRLCVCCEGCQIPARTEKLLFSFCRDCVCVWWWWVPWLFACLLLIVVKGICRKAVTLIKKIAFAEYPVRNYHKSQCAVKSSFFPPSYCHFIIYRAFPKNLLVVPPLYVLYV